MGTLINVEMFNNEKPQNIWKHQISLNQYPFFKHFLSILLPQTKILVAKMHTFETKSVLLN